MQTAVQHDSYHANPGPAGQLSSSSREVIMETLSQKDSYHTNCGPPGKLSCKPQPSRTVILQLWSSMKVIMQIQKLKRTTQKKKERTYSFIELARRAKTHKNSFIFDIILQIWNGNLSIISLIMFNDNLLRRSDSFIELARRAYSYDDSRLYLKLCSFFLQKNISFSFSTSYCKFGMEIYLPTLSAPSLMHSVWDSYQPAFLLTYPKHSKLNAFSLGFLPAYLPTFLP